MAYNVAMTPITLGSFGAAADQLLTPFKPRLEREFMLENFFRSYWRSINYNQVGGNGNEENGVVIKSTDLMRDAGDLVRIPLGGTSGTSEVYGDAVLRGNEGKQTLRAAECWINQRRLGIALAGANALQRTKGLGLVASAVRQLALEDAKNTDIHGMAALWDGFSQNITSSTATTNGGLGKSKIFHQNVYRLGASVSAGSLNATSLARLVDSSTTTDNCTTSDIWTWDAVLAAEALAEELKITPLDVNGEEVYILLSHGWAIKELKSANSSLWKTLSSNGDVRGMGNAIYKRAVGRISNIYIHTSQRVPEVASSNGTAISRTASYTGAFTGGQACRINFLLGRGPLVHAEAAGRSIVKQDDDYMNANGIGLAQIDGWARASYVENASPQTNRLNQSSIAFVVHPGQRKLS